MGSDVDLNGLRQRFPVYLQRRDRQPAGSLMSIADRLGFSSSRAVRLELDLAWLHLSMPRHPALGDPQPFCGCCRGEIRRGQAIVFPYDPKPSTVKAVGAFGSLPAAFTWRRVGALTPGASFEKDPAGQGATLHGCRMLWSRTFAPGLSSGAGVRIDLFLTATLQAQTFLVAPAAPDSMTVDRVIAHGDTALLLVLMTLAFAAVESGFCTRSADRCVA
ncbi:hypothetical protein ACRAWD_18160 [Caulobacter segnis]